MSKSRFLVATIAILSVASLPLTAQAQIVDPVGDFLATYSGTQAPDLDVVASNITFDGTNFNITATMNGAIGTSAGAFYVMGFNRGAGTAGFAATIPGTSNILFDSVVLMRQDTTATINRLGGGGSTNLPAGSVLINGNSLSLTFAASELPGKGFTSPFYTWNLWPRFTNQISDFAPDASNASVVTVPESNTALLFTPALALLVVMAPRRRRVEVKS